MQTITDYLDGLLNIKYVPDNKELRRELEEHDAIAVPMTLKEGTKIDRDVGAYIHMKNKEGKPVKVQRTWKEFVGSDPATLTTFVDVFQTDNLPTTSIRYETLVLLEECTCTGVFLKDFILRDFIVNENIIVRDGSLEYVN